MKKFTQAALAFVVSLGSFSSYAQYDLMATGVTTVATATNQVPPSVPITITLAFKNNGSVAIPDQSTALLAFLNGTDTIETINGVFNGAMAAGAEYTYSSNPFILPAAPPTISLCGFIIMTSGTETNTNNNLTCQGFQVSSSATMDIAIDSLEIIAPSDLDGFDVYNGVNSVPTITEMTLVVKNEGNTILPEGFAINYIFDFEGDQLLAVGSTPGVLQPGESFDQGVTNTAVIPVIPDDLEPGNYEICTYINMANGDFTNDTTCAGFTIIDTYIPPPPIGISEVGSVSANIYHSGSFLWVKDVTSSVGVVLSDVQGRVIANEQFVEDGSISTTSLAAGVYYAQSTDLATGSVHIQKFVLN